MKLLAATLLAMLSAGTADGALIVVGNHQLLPNTPNQSVKVFVTGGDAVQGLNLYAQVADGGPDVGGTIIGPSITSADILTGTIFSSNNEGQDDPGSVPQLAARTTTTAAGTVSASGFLVTLIFDTTGFTTTGSWALNLGDTQNGPTDFSGVPATIIDGSIFIVVPEPSSACFVVGVGLLLRRSRRSNCAG